MISEEQIVKKIQITLKRYGSGIGDDCAVLPFSSDKRLLLTTDMLVEDVDFDFSYCTYGDAGYKSAMANMSDIAAMGGRPLYLLFSLGFPADIKASSITEFYNGVKKAIKGTGVKVVGGDLSSAKKWTVSVTAAGLVHKNNIKLRSGAKPGDYIFITGPLGLSAAGLEILNGKEARLKLRKDFKKTAQWHIRPKAQLTAGELVGKIAGVTAMMDISDGLSTDIHRICAASNCGAAIYKEKIPVSSAVRRISEYLNIDPYKFVLHGGEDFGLLFTCSPKSIDALYRKLMYSGTAPINIGNVLPKKKGIFLKTSTGKTIELLSGGFDHFRNSR